MPSKPDQIPGEVPSYLVSAIKHVLDPLIRLLLTYHITYPMIIRLLKEVYVDVAVKHFKVDNKSQTDSRIRLLTGLHRKEIKQLRTEKSSVEKIPEGASLGARVISAWTAQKEYLDKRGKPKPLARFSTDKEPLSFEELVRSVNKDIRPRSILDEWLRQGIVQLDDKKRVSLKLDAFIPEDGFEDKVYYFGSNVSDHIAASVHNLTGNTPPMLDRYVFCGDLTPESVATLKKLAKEKGMEAIHSINKQAIKLERKDIKKEGPKERISFGIYFYEEPVSSEEDQENDH